MDKVFMGFPTSGAVSADFALSVVALNRRQSDAYELLMPEKEEGPYIHRNRNMLCRRALAADADWLFQVDTDVSFREDILQRLLAHGKSIVFGLYYRIIENRMSPLFFQRNPLSKRYMVEPSAKAGAGLMELDGAGTGISLIHRDVLTAMRAEYPGASPWFAHDPLGEDEELTEDLTFCARAKMLGFQLWGDCDIWSSHEKRLKIVV